MTASQSLGLASASIAEVDPDLWAAIEGSGPASTTRSS